MIEGFQAPPSQLGREQISVPWSPRDALHGVAFVTAGGLLAVSLLSWLHDRSGPENSIPFIPLAIGLVLAITVLAVWLFGIKRYRAPWRTLGFVRPQGRGGMLLPWVALFLSLTFGGLYVVVVTTLGIDFLLPPTIPANALGEGFYRSVNIVGIGILGPMAEEVFFRGFLLGGLAQPMGPLRAALVASAIFAISHLSVGVMIPFFVSGLLLSWLYLKTRSIWPSFTAHAAQNIIAISALAA